jgi:sodium/proline symporter
MRSVATQDELIVTLTFGVYLVGMLLIGWFAFRRTTNLSDFVLGGRRLGSWVTALSASASDMSGWLLLGLPGYAYASGLESAWLALGLLAGTYLNWRILAARLRVFSEHYGNALTIPEYLANRFYDPHGLLRSLSASFILLFFLFYTSSGLVAGGKLFESVFGLPYEYAVAVGALAVIAYTAVGGFLAVSWTDVVQGLLMAAALVAVPLVAFELDGGVGSTWHAIGQLNPALTNPFTDKSGQWLGLAAILSLLAWGLGYFGQPHILARFQAVYSVRDLPRARRIALTWVGLTLVAAILVGLSGIPRLAPPLSGGETEKVFIHLVSLLFHPVIAGICLAAILAAIMSTADSQLLVSSSAFTEDFYRTLIRRQAGGRELVLVGRLAVVTVAALAFGLALAPGSKVLDLVAYAWAGFGAAFGPTLILSLYWRRMTRRGAMAGVLVGGATVVAWKHLAGGWFDVYEILPGFLFSWLAIIVVSLLDRTPEAAQTQAFEQTEWKAKNG